MVHLLEKDSKDNIHSISLLEHNQESIHYH